MRSVKAPLSPSPAQPTESAPLPEPMTVVTADTASSLLALPEGVSMSLEEELMQGSDGVMMMMMPETSSETLMKKNVTDKEKEETSSAPSVPSVPSVPGVPSALEESDVTMSSSPASVPMVGKRPSTSQGSPTTTSATTTVETVSSPLSPLSPNHSPMNMPLSDPQRVSPVPPTSSAGAMSIASEIAILEAPLPGEEGLSVTREVKTMDGTKKRRNRRLYVLVIFYDHHSSSPFIIIIIDYHPSSSFTIIIAIEDNRVEQPSSQVVMSILET